MEVNVVLSSDEILRGLKHYRRIAKQDLLRAQDGNGAVGEEDVETLRRSAEARREIYSQLSEVAQSKGPHEAVREALRVYKDLPFVKGATDKESLVISAKEKALENFFLLVGLQPKIRREVRSQRPSLR